MRSRETNMKFAFVAFYFNLILYMEKARGVEIVTGSLPVNLKSDNLYSKVTVNETLQYGKGIYTKLELGKVKESSVIEDQITYYIDYEFQENQTWAVRFFVSSKNVSLEHPLMVVVQQETNILSWQIPMVLKNNFSSQEISYTLCPVQNRKIPSTVKRQVIYMSLSTSSPVPVEFTLLLSKLTDFVISPETGSKGISVSVAPAQPLVFEYRFPETDHKVFVRAISDNLECMILSVQEIECPIRYRSNDIRSGGLYQSVTHKGGIAVDRHRFSGERFYIVLMVEPGSRGCGEDSSEINSENGHAKNVSLRIIPRGSGKDFVVPIICTVVFYVVLCLIVYLFFPSQPRIWRKLPLLPRIKTTPEQNVTMPSTISVTEDVSISTIIVQDGPNQACEIEKCVEDFTKKSPRFLRGYSWNVFTIAVFYGLPVAQLVYINQIAMFETGNQDMCYYNYQCSHHLWIFYDFNHIFSNIGYIILGLFFNWLVYERSLGMKKCERKITKMGIPHNYDIFYSMGVALVMEGILSSCYHMCPNRSNFQFDTAFMYIISGLCMLKIFQARHSDLAANSYEICGCFAGVVVIGLLGLQTGASLVFWIIFALTHISTVVLFTSRIYHEVHCCLQLGILKKFFIWNEWVKFFHSIKKCTIRNIWLIVVNIINLTIAIYGLVVQDQNFPAFLLNTFIANLLLYLIFYMVMKWKNEKRWSFKWRISTAICVFLCFSIWIIALYFFKRNNTSWKITPAASRSNNRNCIVGGFYDDHDVWHFLSSWALFFSFLLLLILDDDINHVSQHHITVF